MSLPGKLFHLVDSALTGKRGVVKVVESALMRA
jgi:hypothetical protein